MSKGRVYLIESVEPTVCQAGTIKSFLQGKGVPCRRTAKVKFSGLTLCPIHLGTLITNGAIPAGVGTKTWEAYDSKEQSNGPDQNDKGPVGAS